MILIPATVINNVPGSDFCIGCDTAANEIMKMCDCLKQSSDGNQKRVYILETIGNRCGYLATIVALTCLADSLYIPEIPFDIKDLNGEVDRMRIKIDSGISTGLIIKNGAACDQYTTDFMERLLVKEGQKYFITKASQIGYSVQGSLTSPFDRKLSLRYISSLYLYLYMTLHLST